MNNFIFWAWWPWSNFDKYSRRFTASLCSIFRSGSSGTLQHCGRKEGEEEKEAGLKLHWCCCPWSPPSTSSLWTRAQLKKRAPATPEATTVVAQQLGGRRWTSRTTLASLESSFLPLLLPQWGSRYVKQWAPEPAVGTAVTQRRGGRRRTSGTAASAKLVWLPSPPPFLPTSV